MVFGVTVSEARGRTQKLVVHVEKHTHQCAPHPEIPYIMGRREYMLFLFVDTFGW